VNTTAVVFEAPGQLAIRQLHLTPPGDDDLVVDIEFSGISTGTERLLWTGRMPPFPGLAYPLVPGYESFGRVTAAGANTSIVPGQTVFVPGASCFGEVRGLFGGAASQLVVPAQRVVPVDEALGEQAVLMALAATAFHALASEAWPDLIVGHGVLGRLLARITIAAGGEAPMVWENNPIRADGALGYQVMVAEDDPRHDYRRICDVSGDGSLLDALIGRLAPGGEIVLAGFYHEPLRFDFPPAFMREACLRIAAEFQPPDLAAVRELIESGRLSLDGLISHRMPVSAAEGAYRTAFEDPACLKMILDWRDAQ
jgi:3-hydroxyethyl bacteriochlorophyllide a dehydrogenase